MTLVGIGHYHSHLHTFDGISRKTRLTWLRNAAALACLMAFVAAMWVGDNLSALMHTPLMSGISSLGAVVTLACIGMALNLIGLIGVEFFQLRMEQVDIPAT